MPWNMFWTIVWQVVLFCLITCLPLSLWVYLVWPTMWNKKKFTYRG